MSKERRIIEFELKDKNSKRVTSKASKNIKKVGTESKKAGASGAGMFAKLGASLRGVGSAATMATGGIRAMTMALISSGVGAIVVAVGSLIAGITTLVRKSTEFDKAFSNLKAIMQGTNEEMAALKQNAKELGATTAFTASQVIDMQVELAKLGFTTTEILDATGSALDLAAGSSVGLGEAAAVAANTLNGFGLDASETARVADVMSKSFTTSALDMDKFRESMKLLAPISKATKTSLETSAAALALLADRGVAGSMAGTQLRRVFSDLVTKTGKGLHESLEITANKLDNAKTTAEKLAIAKELVGDRAKGSLIALAENREELIRLEGVYQNAEGAAKNLAETKLDNLAGDTTKLGSAWEGLLLSIEDGEGILTTIARGAVQFLTRTVTALTTASEYLGFVFPDMWANMKLSASGGWKVVSGFFGRLSVDINNFAVKAMEAISKVPLLGKLVDKTALAEAQREIANGYADMNLRISEGMDELNEASINRMTRGIRFAAEQNKRELEREEKALKERIEEFQEGQSQEDKKNEDAELKRKEAYLKKLKKMEEDFEAKTEIEKINLKRQRALAEIEALKITETEKGELRKRINKLYDDQIAEQTVESNQKAAAFFKDWIQKTSKLQADQRAKEKAEAEAERQMKINNINSVLDASIGAAGEESKVAKALFLMKQALAIAELVRAAKNTVLKAKLNAAEGGTEVTKGQAKANATLNPFIIAGYVASAIGVVASIASATRKAESVASSAGASVSGGASAAPKVAPSFNLIGNATAGENKIAAAVNERNNEPVKAYVVTKELETQSQLERVAKKAATLG